jgi:N-acetylglucosaminyldiphosphoundecaprenol N-acetyl-beta-D-mannosaminyltransferase
MITNTGLRDDLTRDVYCVGGLPIDALDMATVIERIENAATSRTPFLISTPNLHFLVQSRIDPEFRDSVLDSDVCPADGIAIIWIARLLGLPVKARVSGSDVFEALSAPERLARQLKVFLFGGAEGVAAQAAAKLSAVPAGLSCAGILDPGFGSIDDMSHDQVIDKVNASNADFLAVALGAKKGQPWLYRNHHRLTIPVRVHLGAAINFMAGTVKRAPVWIRAVGFEWLWRIKEEPQLWRRYGYDGWVLLRLLFSRLLPLAIANRWCRFWSQRHPRALQIEIVQNQDSATIGLCGDACEEHIERAIASFQQTLAGDNKNIVIDLSRVRYIDGRFFGALLMLRKGLKERGSKLSFIGAGLSIQRIFRLNELSFLLGMEEVSYVHREYGLLPVRLTPALVPPASQAP